LTAQKGVLELVRKANQFEVTINAESVKAAKASCQEIKVAWLRIAATQAHIVAGSRIGAGNGVLGKSGKIGRGKGTWGVTYGVNGKKRDTLQARVSWFGPVHLVFFPTKPHFMGAKRTNGENVGKYRSAAWGGIEGRVKRGRELNAAFGGSSVKGAMGSYRSAGRTITRGKNKGKFISHGARALNIGSTGANLRPYAFHPGTAGHGTVWPTCQAEAMCILPNGFASARKQGMIAAGFGAATSTGKAVIAA